MEKNPLLLLDIPKYEVQQTFINSISNILVVYQISIKFKQYQEHIRCQTNFKYTNSISYIKTNFQYA